MIASRLPTRDPRFDAIVEEFVTDLEHQISAIEVAWARHVFEILRSRAHFLQGAGGSVGFDEFTEPSGDLERLAKAECDEGVDEVIGVLRELAARVVVDAPDVVATKDHVSAAQLTVGSATTPTVSRLPTQNPRFRAIVKSRRSRQIGPSVGTSSSLKVDFVSHCQPVEQMLSSTGAATPTPIAKCSVGELARGKVDQGFQDTLIDTTIMMVDDATTTLKVLQAFLEDAGYRHFLAVSQPTEAFQVLIDEMPDLVLLDINMPGASGFDILSFMRSREAFQQTPVIVLTSSNDSETKLRALQLGATDFLAKPVDESELILRLRNTLVAKRYIDQQTYYDRITGLANRRLFLDRLERVISWSKRNSRHSAVLVLDVDRFKKINHSLGHSVGDALLHAIARRLEGLVRFDDLDRRADSAPSRGCLARVGGDEFSLLLSDVDSVAVPSRIAERILSELAKSFHIQGHELFVTASIGIALSPENGEDKETLLRHANIAMSHAKRQGRNCHHVYSRESDLQNKHQLQLEGELRRAIEREEFVLHYQPKVDVRSGFVIGAETLVRWQHPTRGIVPPNEFISLAEDAGLIGAIGDWVLSTACRQNAIWHSEGLGLQLAVNVSGNQFQTREFVRQVRIALEESGLPPHFLTLELTESVVVEDAKHNIEILHALKELGIKLSVDDFGTGYSSLSYLEQFPLDELKVDRAFISKIDAATGDAPIVSALIAMAHSLRFIVVAEGVETSHQLDFLSRHKCEQYQGYLFSKPLPADDFAALAVNWRPVRI